MKKIFGIVSLLLTFNLLANSSMKAQIKKLNWNGVEVIYLEDNRFPTYDIAVYFADGALSDGDHRGASAHALNFVTLGTSKLTQQEIQERYEFVGAGLNFEVTHEYSKMSLFGLTKDLEQTLKDTCMILREANYPDNALKSEIAKEKSGLLSMTSELGPMADRAFREVSLGGTPYSYPVNGKIVDLEKLNGNILRNQLDYFLDKVKKRIYITGPKTILSMEKILKNDCRFVGSEKDFKRKIEYSSIKNNGPRLVFIPMPWANQVQVRIGRFLNREEIQDRNIFVLADQFLTGGFTSKLMKEVRVRRGLTYSIQSHIGSQKEYGRALISTFTKNETINRLIEVIENALADVSKNGVRPQEIEHVKGGLKGSHLFRFESNLVFLSELMFYDHSEIDYDHFFNFVEESEKYTSDDLKKSVNSVFDLNQQVIFILGDKSVEKELKKLPKKYGKLKVLNFKDYL
jgi:zinc protease